MVDSATPGVTSSEGLQHQDDQRHRGNKWHSRPNVKHQHSNGEYPRRNSQRFNKGGTPDGTERSYHQSSSASISGRPSNLDRFLEVTTPRVKTQHLPKSCVRDSSQKRCFNPEDSVYFSLGDLWESFDEWSAYGASVPLVLNGGESVVQYYVPYLSAIELYTVPSRRLDTGSSNQGGSESDTSSDTSSDGETEPSHRSYKGVDGPSAKLGGSSKLECRSYEKGEVWSYFETISPYCRVPLVDKIAELSRDFPKENPLRSLRSYELLPNSYLSVAWYPIYRIPTGPTLRDLDACFLTFHPLSKPLQAEGDVSSKSLCGNDVCVMPTMPASEPQKLTAFGLASYKLRGAVWLPNSDKRQELQELQKAAIDHLKRNGVHHPDFTFFMNHATPNRR